MKMYDPYSEFTKHTLPNGLEVHSTFWDRPWITVKAVVHSGGREDPIEMPGLAHFVEHVVSKNIPNQDLNKVKEFFDTCGGQINFGSTGYLTTQYSFKVPADLETFRKALNIFGSMLLEAQIKNFVERERKVILREFNERYPFLEKLEWDMSVQKSVFKGHRLETYNRPLGRPEGFLSATEDDLQKFYDEYYVPANISLVIVGGLPTEQVITELQESSFGISKYGVRNPIPQPFNDISIPLEQSKIVKMSDHVNFKVDHTEYTATWALSSEFPRQVQKVFGQVLWKILFEEVREKRALAYGVKVNCFNFQDICEYEITGSINPDATEHINELVHKCILMVPERRDLFDQKFKASKQRYLMTDLSGTDLVDHCISDLVTDHRIITMQEELNDLEQVTFENIADAASLLSPEKQYTFITCP